MLRCWIALGFVGVVAAVAAAGPISWTYQSTFAPVQEPGVRGDRADAVITGTTIHSSYLSTPAGVGEHAAWGWQTVNVGRLVPNAGAEPNDTVNLRLQLDLTLTDAASGEAGTVSLTGRGDETFGFVQERLWTGELVNDDRFVNSRHVTTFVLSELSADTLTLGGHEYRVRVEPRYGPDGVGYLDAAVTVGDVHLTPEPTTLTAAGLGIFALAAARFRRRS